MQGHDKHNDQRSGTGNILKQCGLCIANGRFELGHHTFSPLLCRAAVQLVAYLFSFSPIRVKNFLGTFANKFENT